MSVEFVIDDDKKEEPKKIIHASLEIIGGTLYLNLNCKTVVRVYPDGRIDTDLIAVGGGSFDAGTIKVNKL